MSDSKKTVCTDGSAADWSDDDFELGNPELWFDSEIGLAVREVFRLARLQIDDPRLVARRPAPRTRDGLPVFNEDGDIVGSSATYLIARVS